MSAAIRVLVAVTVTALLAGACNGDDGATERATTTSIPGSSSAGSTVPPGVVVSDRELVAVPRGRVHLVEYTSEALTGEPITVTGLLARPDREPPPGGFPVLSWAHGTTGVADACAPSGFGSGSIPELERYLASGWVVAATDYEGLGTPGVHPYLVSESQARGVLDAARAARDLFGADVVGTTLAVAGHSQGGHAALATAEHAAAWAPELDLVGTAAIAPAADLERIVPAMFSSTELFTLGVYVAVGWPDAHPELAVTDLLTDAGVEVAESAADDACVFATGGLIGGRPIEELVAAPPGTLDSWSARIAENTVHPDRIPVPVLLAQGGADGLVLPALTDALHAGMCEADVPTRYVVVDGAGHGSIVEEAADDIERWLTDRVAGAPAPDDC